MAIDTAAKRRAAGGLPFPLGPGVTPNVSKGPRWRLQAAWGYAGLDVVAVTGDLASAAADITGDTSALVGVDGALASTAASVDGLVEAIAAADGALASGSAAIAGDVLSTVLVDGTLSSPSAAIEGEGAASVSAAGDLLAVAASIDGQVTPDQITEFLHPNADIADDGWTGHDGGANLFQYIDEAVANDADYVRSPVVPSGETFRVAVTNPVSAVVLGSPVIVRYRIGKTNAGATINFKVRLFAGATEIAEWLVPNVAAGFTTGAQSLTAPQIAAISDFDELELEFEAEAA